MTLKSREILSNPSWPPQGDIKPLIDADMLRYEVGFGVEFKEGEGKFIHNFDAALELLEHKVDVILAETEATLEPAFYLTQDRRTAERHKEDYVPNFREDLWTTREYKGNRPSSKPFHYDNLTEYLLSQYDCVIASGLEADDLLSIEQNKEHDYTTVICSRDKDLRITPGWHYTWECGKARAYGPHYVETLGELQPPEKGKLFGTGLKFFYAQMIMGDTVDNIPGLPGKGPALAYKLLHDCETEEELFDKVVELYKEYVQDHHWIHYFREQANLLWMVQELDEGGKPVLYKMVDER